MLTPSPTPTPSPTGPIPSTQAPATPHDPHPSTITLPSPFPRPISLHSLKHITLQPILHHYNLTGTITRHTIIFSPYDENIVCIKLFFLCSETQRELIFMAYVFATWSGDKQMEEICEMREEKLMLVERDGGNEVGVPFFVLGMEERLMGEDERQLHREMEEANVRK